MAQVAWKNIDDSHLETIAKSYRMLYLLANTNGRVPVSELTAELATSEGSVRAYINYFRKAMKGHPQIAISVLRGNKEQGGGVGLAKEDVSAAKAIVQERIAYAADLLAQKEAA